MMEQRWLLPLFPFVILQRTLHLSLRAQLSSDIFFGGGQVSICRAVNSTPLKQSQCHSLPYETKIVTLMMKCGIVRPCCCASAASSFPFPCANYLMQIYVINEGTLARMATSLRALSVLGDWPHLLQGTLSLRGIYSARHESLSSRLICVAFRIFSWHTTLLCMSIIYTLAMFV